MQLNNFVYREMWYGVMVLNFNYLNNKSILVDYKLWIPVMLQLSVEGIRCETFCFGGFLNIITQNPELMGFPKHMSMKTIDVISFYSNILTRVFDLLLYIYTH